MDCLELFQSYIHRTSDLQTVATAVLHSPLLNTHKYVNGWIDCYTDLLDRWMLWEQRAQFDVNRNTQLPPKVFVRCSHCGENISSRKKSKTDHGANAVGVNT